MPSEFESLAHRHLFFEYRGSVGTAMGLQNPFRGIVTLNPCQFRGCVVNAAKLLSTVLEEYDISLEGSSPSPKAFPRDRQVWSKAAVS